MASRIDRRLLVSYRLDPAVARRLVPRHLELDTVDGDAVGGMCLIRLSRTRPVGLPAVGGSSENVAHRVAVRWRAHDGWVHGVYIPTRHSASRAAVAAGGRLFPGTHRRAAFAVRDDVDRLHLEVRTDDLQLRVQVATGGVWQSTLFDDPGAASRFYRAGAVGLSPRRDGSLEGVRLAADRWPVEPATLSSVSSSFYDALPVGSAVPDSALLMRDLDVTWHRVEAPAVTPAVTTGG